MMASDLTLHVQFQSTLLVNLRTTVMVAPWNTRKREFEAFASDDYETPLRPPTIDGSRNSETACDS